jgi:hypothetical protein
MSNLLEKPMAEVEKSLEQPIIDQLITDWGGRIKDDKFVMTKAQIGNLFLLSGYFHGLEADEATRNHPRWRLAEGVRALIDNTFFQEIFRSLAVTDENEFELAMEKAGVSRDMRQRLQWVLQEHDGVVPLTVLVNPRGFGSQDAARKFVSRYAKAFEKTFWRIRISKNNLEIFKPKKVPNKAV